MLRRQSDTHTQRVMAARALILVALVALVAFAVHRLLTAMERRGWIYYRTKGTGSMGASTLFSLNEVFHPGGHGTTVELQERDLRGARPPAPGDPPE